MQRPDLIAVTGGEGFIGRQLRSMLIKEGKKVISLDSRPPLSPQLGHSYRCDISDETQVQRVFSSERVSCIVHLASLLRTASVHNPARATEVNIMGARNILEAARASKVPRVVYASSLGVYGSKPSSERVVEEDTTAPEDLYGAGKKYVEMLGEGYARDCGFAFVSLRIPIVVGRGAVGTSSPWRSEIFENFSREETREVFIPYKGDETLPLVHVDDLANVIAVLIRATAISFPAYNVPCEVWDLKELKRELETLRPNLVIGFGESSVVGFPRMISADRYRREFEFSPLSLIGRLRDATQVRLQQ